MMRVMVVMVTEQTQMRDNNVQSTDTHCKQKERERGNGQNRALWRRGESWRGRAVLQIIRAEQETQDEGISWSTVQ